MYRANQSASCRWPQHADGHLGGFGQLTFPLTNRQKAPQRSGEFYPRLVVQAVKPSVVRPQQSRQLRVSHRTKPNQLPFNLRFQADHRWGHLGNQISDLGGVRVNPKRYKVTANKDGQQQSEAGPEQPSCAAVLYLIGSHEILWSHSCHFVVCLVDCSVS